MQFKISLIQQQFSRETVLNQNLMLQCIKSAADKGANIVVLSELHDSHYFCQIENQEYFKLAETIPGPATNLYSKTSKELDIVLIISLFEKDDNNNYYNTAVVIERGKIAGTYRKHHIPNCEEYKEQYYFQTSDQEVTPIKTHLGNIGVLICYDQWFPEIARKLAVNDADIIVIPTAIGFNPKDVELEKQRQLDAWITIQRAHAIANCIPVAVCNRVGFEQEQEAGIHFWGNSFIAGPFGEIISQAGCNPEIISADIDLSENLKVSSIWPFLNERKF